MTPALGTLGAGYRLGRYELLLPIAQGGMAVVWAARMKGSRGFSKIVAVKTMLPGLSGDPHFQQLFLAEAELASRIKHPNVCEILDLGEQKHVLYIVMEWVDGESLATLLGTCKRDKRPIPYAIATKIGLEASRGLHAAHELRSAAGEFVGLVHRDVSPQNILVTFDGIVKIVDFGVAKAVALSEHQSTKTGHVKGKIQYMAPEQAFCDAIDRRTDVFTLGIVLYQLTTGVHPFRADNDLATLARITGPEPVAPPESIVKGYPKVLSAVVSKALEKDPAARYGSMADFARDLEVVLAKLSALGEAEDVEPFVRDVLGPRAAERATAIKDALRDADRRTASRRPLSGATSKGGDGASAGDTSNDDVLASGIVQVAGKKGSFGGKMVVAASAFAALAGAVVYFIADRPVTSAGPAASAPIVAAPIIAPAPTEPTAAIAPRETEPIAVSSSTPQPAPGLSAAQPVATPKSTKVTPKTTPASSSSATKTKFRKADF